MRDAFADGLEPLIDILAQSIPGKIEGGAAAQSVAAMAGLVGALTLARAVEGTSLSDEILEAARRELAGRGASMTPRPEGAVCNFVP